MEGDITSLENSSNIKVGGRSKSQQRQDRKKKLLKKNKKKWETEVEEANELQSRYDSIIPENLKTFADFPLCKKTLLGLKKAGYTNPTEIQRSSIGLALKGHDILGAAKMVLMLDCLFRERWTPEDGLGVLIISPTRELAYQTFEVLYKIGKQHEFSAGLVIGGKDVEEESAQIGRTNIVVCTPGRLLQHLDGTPDFECRSLKMLVVDEADRILDLGFKKTINAILDHLPTTRQTLLFSATQTKSVKDLARLSLRDPKYIAVHEHHEHSTPAQLEQSYIVCELQQKINILFSFIKAHRNKKVLVFMASCKQVKFTFEVFCKLRPSTTVMSLYGTLNQLRRVSIYDEFCKKPSAVLIATDIAARGLDFPAVDWVIQVDCPEDASTYIHRVGRTARYEKDGESLLFLLPSEEYAMVKQLNDKKIPILKIEVNPSKKMVIYRKLQSYCAQDPELKESGKRAFISYVKSVYLMKNKDVFDVTKLPLEEYAVSLGLPFTPRIRFLERRQKQQQDKSLKENKSSGEQKIQEEDSLFTKKEVANNKGNEGNDWRREKRLRELEELKPDSGDEEADEFLVKKEGGILEGIESEDDDLEEHFSSKKPQTKIAILKKAAKDQRNTKIRFARGDKNETKSDTDGDGEDDNEGEYEKGLNLREAEKYMREADKEDKQRYQERIKAKHKEERIKRKQAKQKDEDDNSSDEEEYAGVQLDVGDNFEEFDVNTLPKPMSDMEDESNNESDEEDGESGSEETEGEEEAEERWSKDGEDSSTDEEREDRLRLAQQKRTPQREGNAESKRKKIKTSERDETGLTLEDDEELALHILSGRS
ncbi:putative ATP-dependent RNA helicase DDX10 [Apostichopus japonicus]|uniref:ATP-dependent RNA helicase n=1 Tax=Stichopus japonicus TaxID=307972 RepID=A0A2G8L3M3_STIJA|nr:putative ATP-dependent RNA helicase DDX10 [Apostichopus japonicus]